MAKHEFPNEEELARQIAKARAEGKRRDAEEPRAVSARYDRKKDLVLVELANGALFGFPPRLVQGLAGAQPKHLAEVEVTPGGRGLHWETLDTDHSVPALVAGIFGTSRWMAEMGRAGGRAKSAAKSDAARANGRKGGRPRRAVIRAS
jgi:hypothetical protein